MDERKSIPRKTRFEVFKRDSFTCQYCGDKPPNAILEIDHINPISKGGQNNIINLITSCINCNQGKSNRTLSDNSVIEKQHEQLKILQSQREQLEMMYKWQRGLLTIENDAVKNIAKFWSEQVKGFTLTENGVKSLSQLYSKFGLVEVMEAIRIACSKYLQYKDGAITKESVNRAWGKVGGICCLKRKEKTNPTLAKTYYIRGILRNRMYVNEKYVMKIITNALNRGLSIEEIENLAKTEANWTNWCRKLEKGS